MTKLYFAGDSFNELASMPRQEITEAARALSAMQQGKAVTTSVDMGRAAKGVLSLSAGNTTIFTAKIENSLYVLHCAEKGKEQNTAVKDNYAMAKQAQERAQGVQR